MLQWWEAFSCACFSEPPPAALITGPGAALWARCARAGPWEGVERLILTTCKKKNPHQYTLRVNTHMHPRALALVPAWARGTSQSAELWWTTWARTDSGGGSRCGLEAFSPPSHTSETRDYVTRRPPDRPRRKLLWGEKTTRRGGNRTETMGDFM